MKVSIGWIQHVLGRTMDVTDVASCLERAGLEIEQLNSSKKLDQNVKLVLVKKIVQHPHADKLKIVEVSNGEAIVTVVCGAPNVREGMMAAWASPGTVLPDGREIQRATLRGVDSEGMLCSELELQLGTSHEGIMAFEGTNEVGTSLCDIVTNDVIVDLKTPPNRFDVLSVIGLAREVAAMAGDHFEWQAPQIFEPVGESMMGEIQVEEKIVPQLIVAKIKFDGVLAPTTRQHANWLAASDMREVNPIVDWTNLTMLELGQPLHAYDAANVKLPIIVRHAKDGETITTLDGVTRQLTPDDLLITDQLGPLGLAGVMGGARAEVSASTTEIILEAATFDAATIRKMAKRHNLRSEASARFERGLPVQLAPLALSRSIAGMGGNVTQISSSLRVWPWTQRVGVRLSALSSLLGIKVGASEVVASLGLLGIEARPFDIVTEAKKHLGKPYIWGASFRKNGTDGFDCSYLTDYLYSLIGCPIGFTSLAQFESGTPVEIEELRPGDILFYEGMDTGGNRDFALDEISSGQQSSSVVGHYYKRDDTTGEYVRIQSSTDHLVGHNGLYIGDGKVLHAARYEYKDKEWVERETPSVCIDTLDTYTANPGFLGARRYVDDLSDYVSVPCVPWWRTDVKIEADIIEEVIRVLGYDRIPASLPQWRATGIEFDRVQPKIKRLHEILQSLGLFELMTYSFVAEYQLNELGLPIDDYLKLRNPLSHEQAYLRRELLPSLLAAASRNANFGSDLAVYEISKVFHGSRDTLSVDEPLRLAILVKTPHDALKRLRGFLDILVSALPAPLRATNLPQDHMIRGRSGQIILDDHIVGTIGQIHPQITRASKVGGETAYLEIDLELIIASMGSQKYEKPPRFPAIKRDISVSIVRDNAWSDVSKVLGDNPQVQSHFVSDYYNDDLPSGTKVMTIGFVFINPERTLTEAEADEMLNTQVELLRSQLGAVKQD